MYAQRNSDSRGFVSLEVLAAVTIVAVTLLSIAAMFLTAHANVERSGRTTIAVALARQMIEELRSLPYDSLVALDGVDTTASGSVPANEPERTVARRWRYAVAGAGDGWSFSESELAGWSTLHAQGLPIAGRIEVDSPAPGMRGVTVTMTVPGSPGEVRLGTLISRTDP